MKYLLLALCVAVVAVVAQQPLSVVPYPQTVQMGSGSVTVCPSKFSVTTNSQSTVFAVALKRYQSLFFPFGNGSQSGCVGVTVSITVSSDDENLFLGVDESYTLLTNGQTNTITSNTIYGAMRAIETLKQIIQYNLNSQTYGLVQVKIYDEPRFPWRGFMVDTARHFLPKNAIFHIIDALGYNKFNTLHLHLVDAQSFPVESNTYPNLTNAAFGPGATFSHQDLQEIVAYAQTYGIRVVPEFDIPGHSASWGVGYPDLVANCPAYAANINNIALDVSNPNTYTFLQNFFNEMATIFPDQYFHTGGDEVVTGCWAQDPNMQSWMNKMHFSTIDALTYFEHQLSNMVTAMNKTKMIWNDPFDYGCTLSTDQLVQVWLTGSLPNVLNAGFKAIVSFAWYFDKQIPDGNTHYEWQDTWQDFYNADPYNGITNNSENILGGEGTMFAEQISHVNWDVRVWPRAIGLAERLWSEQSVNSVPLALPRIGAFSCDMSRRGILSGPLFTDYCPLPEDLTLSPLKPVMEIPKDIMQKLINRQ
ncbi:hypothetical protein CYY_008443 [Polysphondylium violaceum]|uniref:Beta-hexosaminidase n=1 Tax=Polysphondylium violaceum TaxID=133409 RepID=A0A8J4PNC9_9MYCE|nr:hypothetical protein CYY_008443 [Polysphondylium violaceum]